MRGVDFGRYIYAAGVVGFGILSLIFGKFALQWQAFPAWIPAGLIPEWLAYVNGTLLLFCGIGLCLARRWAVACAQVLFFYLLFWVILQAINAAPTPLNTGALLPPAEDLVLMCGAWLVYAGLAPENGLAALSSEKSRIVLRWLFGLACLVFGLSHFQYAEFTSQMVPAWLPFRLELAYLTGAGHFAAGLALISGVLPRLGATCEAIMMSLFVLLVHIPMVITPPPPEAAQLYWTMLCAASGMAGAAWMLAVSLRVRPWLQLPGRSS